MRKSIFLFLLACSIGLVSCGGNNHTNPSGQTPAATTCNVSYSVTSSNTGVSASIAYTLPDGSTFSAGTQTLPFTSPTYVFQKGIAVALAWGFVAGPISNISCHIYENGSLVAGSSTLASGDAVGFVLN